MLSDPLAESVSCAVANTTVHRDDSRGSTDVSAATTTEYVVAVEGSEARAALAAATTLLNAFFIRVVAGYK